MATYMGKAPYSTYRKGGSCSRCARADRLVDIDVHIDMEGAVALCTGCIADIALAAGYVLTEAGAAKLATAEARAEHAEHIAEEANRTISALHDAFERIQKRPGAADRVVKESLDA